MTTRARAHVTPAQGRVLDALARTGTTKGAAKVLGVSPRTVEMHASTAAFRLGVRNRLLAVLKWDRLVRAGEKPVSHQAGRTPLATTIYRLAARPEGTTSSEVAVAADVTVSEANSRLGQLVRSGKVRRGEHKRNGRIVFHLVEESS